MTGTHQTGAAITGAHAGGAGGVLWQATTTGVDLVDHPTTAGPARQAHALTALAALVRATGVPEVSIKLYSSGRISIQIPQGSGPAPARAARLAALAAAFDTHPTPLTPHGGVSGHQAGTVIEAQGTLAGHPIEVFTTIHADTGRDDQPQET